MWPGCEVKACRFHLGQSWWRKIQSLGLSRQYGKKDSEVSQFLKKIFGLSLLPTAEVTDCFVLDFISNLPNKLVEEFCDYLLEILYWCRLHFSSICLVRMFCIIIEDHKGMWVIPCPFQCTILQCASQYFCSCICTAENTEYQTYLEKQLNNFWTWNNSMLME